MARDPLNAIQGFARLLLDGQTAGNSVTTREGMTWIARAADQKSLMRGGLLALVCVATGTLAHEYVDLAVNTQD